MDHFLWQLVASAAGVVCKETFTCSGVCQALVPYEKHADLTTRLAAVQLLTVWRAIYRGATRATTATSFESEAS